MRIAQIVLPGASEYERKSQRADHAALSEQHDVTVSPIETIASLQADLAHVYGNGELPARAFVGFPLPYVASGDVRTTRWSWRRPVRPRFVVSPLGEEPLPEVVEEAYFPVANRVTARAAPHPNPLPSAMNLPWGEGTRGENPLPSAMNLPWGEGTRGENPLPSAMNRPGGAGSPSGRKIVGSFGRPSVRNSVEQTMARIRRFRDDVDWQVYERPPSPEDLASVDVWVDPAVDESDLDGFTAEALVVGLSVVATRTAINVLRLEKGRTGFLVPPRDPNEMTHVILSALFKTEVAESRQFAAKQTVSKFRARQRLRILTRLYETVRDA